MASFAEFCWDNAAPLATVGAFLFTLGVNWARVGTVIKKVDKINDKIADHESRISHIEGVHERGGG